MEINWLKKISVRAGLSVKEWADSEIHGISIRRQCELLEVNRSTVNYTSLRELPEIRELMRIQDERYLLYPTEVLVRIQDHLLTLQISAN